MDSLHEPPFSRIPDVISGVHPDNPLSESVAGVILGTQGFVEWVKNQFVNTRGKDRDLPSVNRLQVNPITIDAIRTRLKDEKVISEKMRGGPRSTLLS